MSSKSNKSHKKETVKESPKKSGNQTTLALMQSRALNNFGTNYEFTKALGLELLKGSATSEQIETLVQSIEGLKDFIDLLQEKLKEKK